MRRSRSPEGNFPKAGRLISNSVAIAMAINVQKSININFFDIIFIYAES